METSCSTVLVVSDVRLYRDHLAGLLAAHEPRMAVETCPGGAAAVDRIIARGFCLLLVDLRSRDSHHTLQTIAGLSPRSRLIAFAVDDDNAREVLACAEAGVSGYVPGDASAEELIRAVEAVANGERHLPPSVAAALLRRLAAHDVGDATATGHLTARERQIVALVVRGMTNKEIASELHIEVATVKNHVHNLLLKLRVTSRFEAAARLAGSGSGSRSGSRSWMHIPD